jgi:hypothetical protein
MKAQYTSGNGLVFDLEAEAARDVFSQVASIQELFEAEQECGMCKSREIRFSHRIVDDNSYYELVCRGCRAHFRFGQKKKGGELFPKRKDEDGHWLPNGGWSRYTPPGQQEERPAASEKPVAPAMQSTGTDAKTQERYNRLATAWGVTKAPVNFAGLVQMARDYFGELTSPSTTGQQEFDKLYRRYMFEHANDSLHPNNISTFMKEVFEAANTLKKDQVPY